MKIIALEEHHLHPALAKASGAHMANQAKFMQGWNSRFTDSPPQHIAPAAESAQKLFTTAEARLADMDAAGIDIQVLSHGGAPQLAAMPDALNLHRAANDALADTIAQHPTRFLGFATLPWQDPDAATQELYRCTQELGFKGALINGRPRGQDFLDHPDFAPLLQAFSELGVPYTCTAAYRWKACVKPTTAALTPKLTRASPHSHGVGIMKQVYISCACCSRVHSSNTAAYKSSADTGVKCYLFTYAD